MTHIHKGFSPDNKVCMLSVSLVADWPGSADIHVLFIQVSEL